MSKSEPAAAAPAAPPATIVIFGARGDLTKRLLIPSICNLAHAGLLDDKVRILGVDHGACDDAGFRETVGDFIKGMAKDKKAAGATALEPQSWRWVEERLHYLKGDFEDASTYTDLGREIERLGGAGANVLFYLATAPRFFGPVVDQLGQAGLCKPGSNGFRRVVIEKPFGVDLASAKALNRRLLKALNEDQIYRIDHFLGKETVRNIMVTRFANGVFEPLWSRLHIDHVQITAAETVGVEDRGGYYDQAGALRDMIPSHLFQLLALTAMEPPNSLDAEAIRTESAKVIEAIVRQSPKQAASNSARGQYRAGVVNGKAIDGYRNAPNVDPKSRTETFAALKLTIDNWRWAGVPFYLRTGKALAARDTEIAIQFKLAPQALFGKEGATPNVLVLQIQPDEGISLQFEAKRPGPQVRPAPVEMEFKYAQYFESEPATGYETLIYDVLIGDQTLFKRADDVEYAWAAVMPFLNAWRDDGEPQRYDPGSAGPTSADDLLLRDGRRWRPIG